MRKILVTGGSGFIGTNLIHSFLKDKYYILNIDKNPPLDSTQIAFWKQVDILDYELLNVTITNFNPEVIIHLAAITDLNGKTLSYYEVNIQGTKNLIDIAKNVLALKKIIFTSSMYVCRPGFIPSDYDTYKPHTLYGESKVASELLVKKIHPSPYEWIIIRPTSIWGPWFNIPYIDFFDVIYKGRYFDFGRSCTKTYGFIENTVFQIRKLIDQENIHKRIFYLGDLPAIRISEWANEISIEFGKGEIKRVPFLFIKLASYLGDILSIIDIKFPITSFRLSNMTTDNILPIEDLNLVIGNAPVSRIDGVRKTVEWLKNNKQY